MKVFKWIMCFIGILILILVIYVFISYQVNKYNYKKEIVSYLSERYTEQMVLDDCEYSLDQGYIAYFYVQNNPDISFRTRRGAENTFFDDYLQEVLKNEIGEGVIKTALAMYPESAISYDVDLGALNLIRDPKLDELYVKLGRAPSWSEYGKLPTARVVLIRINEDVQKINEEDISNIVKKLSKLQYNIDELRIFLYNKKDSKSYSFKWNELNKIDSVKKYRD